MWNKPWSLKEGVAIGGGLVLVGLLLQLFAGPVDWDVFACPVNVIVLSVLLLLLGTGFLLRKKLYAVQFLMSWKAVVPTLGYAVLLTIVMGLTWQVSSESEPADPIGFSKMLSFWPFVLVYVWIALMAGWVAIRQMAYFQFRCIPSLASHVGLFLLLVCGSLGSADMRRLKMYCEYEQPEWRALDSRQMIHELDWTITLNRFVMEQYEGEAVPKRFASEVEVVTRDGERVRATVEVNRPLTIDGWKVYQYGYDQMAGAGSRYSVFELVRDPWMPVVYVGLALLAAGAVGLFFVSRRSVAFEGEGVRP